MEKPFYVFCCYAHKDQQWLLELKTHLAPLQREGLITLWDDMDIYPGDEWEKEIHRHLETAQIILLLVSPNFIASDYSYSVEMQQAMRQYEQGQARVIPIILHPVSWKKTPFGKLQALPINAKAITSSYWPHPNEAFYSIVKGIRNVIEALEAKNHPKHTSFISEQIFYLNSKKNISYQRRLYHILYDNIRLVGVLILFFGLLSGWGLAKLPFLIPFSSTAVVPTLTPISPISSFIQVAPGCGSSDSSIRWTTNQATAQCQSEGTVITKTLLTTSYARQPYLWGEQRFQPPGYVFPDQYTVEVTISAITDADNAVIASVGISVHNSQDGFSLDTAQISPRGDVGFMSLKDDIEYKSSGGRVPSSSVYVLKLHVTPTTLSLTVNNGVSYTYQAYSSITSFIGLDIFWKDPGTKAMFSDFKYKAL